MPDRRDVSVSQFFHRIGDHGVYHSICHICLQTVCSSPRESKLIAGEEEHRCKCSPGSLSARAPLQGVGP